MGTESEKKNTQTIFIFIKFTNPPPPPPTHGAPCIAGLRRSDLRHWSQLLLTSAVNPFRFQTATMKRSQPREWQTCCPFHLTRLYHLNNRRADNGVYLCNCLQPPVTFFMHPNILLSISLWNVLNLCHFRKVRDHVSHPYSTKGKKAGSTVLLSALCLLHIGRTLASQNSTKGKYKSCRVILLNVYQEGCSLT